LRGGVADEAIQLSFAALDCFASLAMTVPWLMPRQLERMILFGKLVATFPDQARNLSQI